MINYAGTVQGKYTGKSMSPTRDRNQDIVTQQTLKRIWQQPPGINYAIMTTELFLVRLCRYGDEENH